jgi:DNA-directed RNA polymerase specialized sigma24 family protein
MQIPKMPIGNEELERVKPYIVTYVSTVSHSLPSYMNTEDLLQEAMFKYWRVAQTTAIAYPKAYLWFIVHSLFVSFLRTHKPLLKLTFNDEGEPTQGSALIFVGEGLGDPEREVEQKMAFVERLDEVVRLVLELSPVQKVAFICYLRDKLDDAVELFEVFSKYGVDITSISWPEESVARQRLQVSCSHARKKIAARLQCLS